MASTARTGRTAKAAKPRRRARIGDVIEIDTARGRAYAQFTHKDIRPFDTLIRVLPGFFLKRPDDLAALVRSPERYFIFFPIGSAAWQGYVTIIGNEPVPDWCRKAPRMRYGTSNIRGEWRLILAGRRLTAFKRLTEDEMKLSLAEAWTYATFVFNLERDWDPTHVT